VQLIKENTMKKLAFLAMFVASVQSFGVKAPTSRVIDASVNNIPTTFSSAAGSLVFAIPAGVTNIKVINQTACGVALNGLYTAPPSAGDSHNIYSVDPTLMLGVIQNNIFLGGNLYLRSNCSPSAAITSGTVTVEVW
jgi:hypothetical protein